MPRAGRCVMVGLSPFFVNSWPSFPSVCPPYQWQLICPLPDRCFFSHFPAPALKRNSSCGTPVFTSEYSAYLRSCRWPLRIRTLCSSCIGIVAPLLPQGCPGKQYNCSCDLYGWAGSGVLTRRVCSQMSQFGGVGWRPVGQIQIVWLFQGLSVVDN